MADLDTWRQKTALTEVKITGKVTPANGMSGALVDYSYISKVGRSLNRDVHSAVTANQELGFGKQIQAIYEVVEEASEQVDGGQIREVGVLVEAFDGWNMVIKKRVSDSMSTGRQKTVVQGGQPKKQSDPHAPGGCDIPNWLKKILAPKEPPPDPRTPAGCPPLPPHLQESLKK